MEREIVPRHAVIEGFLTAEQLAALEAHLSGHAGALHEIAIETDVNGNGYAGSRRLWQVPQGLGPCEDWFTRAIEARLDELFAGIGVAPFTPARFEYELNAQFDGNFFVRHIDSDFGAAAAGRTSDRVISAVFYFPLEGANFTGGDLEIYPFNGTRPAVSIAPRRNRLLAFPSFAWHGVAPVQADDRGLANARLSINCWIHRARPGAAK